MTPAGPCSTTRRYSEATCLNTSKPMAASSPARAAARIGTGRRGSLAIIAVNITHATRTDSASDTPRNGPASLSAGSAAAVRPRVSRVARNTDTSAPISETLVLTNPAVSVGCPHTSVSAIRRFDIHPSPAHSAVARPITPTEVRESMAESIRLLTWSAKSPDAAALTQPSISASTSGRLAKTNPTTAKPTISNGNNAKMVK